MGGSPRLPGLKYSVELVELRSPAMVERGVRSGVPSSGDYNVYALSAATGTKLWGMNPDDIRHICIAADAKLGRKDLDKLNIKRITV